jgi:Holliday junction resolvase RusA-like endonuclease
MRPVPKARARVTYGKRKVHAYTPRRTIEAQECIEAAAIAAGIREPWRGAVGMSIEFQFKMPKSWSAKKMKAQIGKLHPSRTDKDNLEKTVTDALEGIAYVDDAQVAVSMVKKIWSDKDLTTITIRQEDEDGE